MKIELPNVLFNNQEIKIDNHLKKTKENETFKLITNRTFSMFFGCCYRANFCKESRDHKACYGKS